MQGDILQQLTPKTKRAKFLPKPENVACRSILTSCRAGSAGTGSCAAATADPTCGGRGAWAEKRVTSGLCSRSEQAVKEKRPSEAWFPYGHCNP